MTTAITITGGPSRRRGHADPALTTVVLLDCLMNRCPRPRVTRRLGAQLLGHSFQAHLSYGERACCTAASRAGGEETTRTAWCVSGDRAASSQRQVIVVGCGAGLDQPLPRLAPRARTRRRRTQGFNALRLAVDILNEVLAGDRAPTRARPSPNPTARASVSLSFPLALSLSLAISHDSPLLHMTTRPPESTRRTLHHVSSHHPRTLSGARTTSRSRMKASAPSTSRSRPRCRRRASPSTPS